MDTLKMTAEQAMAVLKVPEMDLHLFDRTQADLNWDNPKVREELKR